MSSSEPNSSSAPPSTPGENKPQGSLGLVVLTLGLLGALVWAMAPARLKITPAPLRPAPKECPKNIPEFVPSDVTEAPGVDLKSFPNEQRNHILFRLNMEPCPCGCNLSIAACRMSHAACPVCKGLVEKIVDEESRGKSQEPEARSQK